MAKNTSAKAYEDVRVTFETVDDKGLLGVAASNVGRLAAHSSAKFETQPMPANWHGYSLPQITGTPQP